MNRGEYAANLLDYESCCSIVCAYAFKNQLDHDKRFVYTSIKNVEKMMKIEDE